MYTLTSSVVPACRWMNLIWNVCKHDVQWWFFFRLLFLIHFDILHKMRIQRIYETVTNLQNAHVFELSPYNIFVYLSTTEHLDLVSFLSSLYSTLCKCKWLHETYEILLNKNESVVLLVRNLPGLNQRIFRNCTLLVELLLFFNARFHSFG